jgi:uncharacterized protein YbaR (Trm112 family)
VSLISSELLEILRCTVCKEKLTENEADSMLECPNGHHFEVADRIPNMLPPD